MPGNVGLIVVVWRIRANRDLERITTSYAIAYTIRGVRSWWGVEWQMEPHGYAIAFTD